MDKLTALQKFAIDLIEKNGTINACHLASKWAFHKTGKYISSSRDRFGYTSSAYRTLRKLAKDKLVGIDYEGPYRREKFFKLC